MARKLGERENNEETEKNFWGEGILKLKNKKKSLSEWLTGGLISLFFCINNLKRFFQSRFFVF